MVVLHNLCFLERQPLFFRVVFQENGPEVSSYLIDKYISHQLHELFN